MQKTKTMKFNAYNNESGAKVLNNEDNLLNNFNKLMDIYENYKKTYLPLYIKELEAENKALKKNFPNVDFYILSRLKSKHSYKEKILKKGKAYDIFGDKIILLSVNGKTDENLLIQTAYKMQDFLTTYNPNSLELINRRKDYIKVPKPSKYSSLHITRNTTQNNVSYNRETQIKTFRMREIEENGTASHAHIYKNSRNSLLSHINNVESAEYYLPLYMHFEPNRFTKEDFLVIDNFNSRFKYFFNITFADFLKEQELLLE